MSVSANHRIIYPDSDGQPIADNTKQFRWIVLIKENLERLFADRPDVFKEGNLQLVEEINGWVSPKLGIKFVLSAETLEIYRPDGRKFLSSLEF